MSFLKSGASAFGKLFTVLILVVAFFVGMAAVVYKSLQGEEIKVPEIVGKDFVESEKELALLGLKIKKRADRFSEQKMNTVLEQLPKPGETVKTGQMILVVVSKENPEGKKIDTIKQDDEQEEIDKIEELISDKPKNSDKKDNSGKKKSSKTRDVIANKPDEKEDSETAEKKTGDSGEKTTGKDDKNPTGGDKTNVPKAGEKPPENKAGDNKKPTETAPKPVKTPVSPDTRPRRTPQP
ncbi:MAG: PASTA domain-containing protein [Pyrinomonadaceae bacterium]